MEKKQTSQELKVGLFVIFGIGLAMLSILMLGGGTEGYFARQSTYTTRFDDVDGLFNGAKVVLNGIRVGTVKEVDFDSTTQNVRVTLSLLRKYSDWIREGSVAAISTQGVLGDKFISITSGSQNNPILKPGSELPRSAGKNFTELLSNSERLLLTLQSVSDSLDRVLKSMEHRGRAEMFFQGMAVTAKNMGSASERLNQQLEDIKLKNSIEKLDAILDKVNRGKGTLGALINDPELYEDVKSLISGTSRNRIMRNLIRKTIKDSESGEGSPSQSTP